MRTLPVLPKHADSMWYGKTRSNVFQGIMMGSYHDQYRRYCETLTAMDRDIVSLPNKIDEMGLRDNTLDEKSIRHACRGGDPAQDGTPFGGTEFVGRPGLSKKGGNFRSLVRLPRLTITWCQTPLNRCSRLNPNLIFWDDHAG